MIGPRDFLSHATFDNFPQDRRLADQMRTDNRQGAAIGGGQQPKQIGDFLVALNRGRMIIINRFVQAATDAAQFRGAARIGLAKQEGERRFPRGRWTPHPHVRVDMQNPGGALQRHAPQFCRDIGAILLALAKIGVAGLVGPRLDGFLLLDIKAKGVDSGGQDDLTIAVAQGSEEQSHFIVSPTQIKPQLEDMRLQFRIEASVRQKLMGFLLREQIQGVREFPRNPLQSALQFHVGHDHQGGEHGTHHEHPAFGLRLGNDVNRYGNSHCDRGLVALRHVRRGFVLKLFQLEDMRA